MMFERKLAPIINELLNEFRIIYLTGQRQAGKTTLTKLIAQKNGLEYISFDNQTILLSAQNDPIGFINSFNIPRHLEQYKFKNYEAAQNPTNSLTEYLRKKELRSVLISEGYDKKIQGYIKRIDARLEEISDKHEQDKISLYDLKIKLNLNHLQLKGSVDEFSPEVTNKSNIDGLCQQCDRVLQEELQMGRSESLSTIVSTPADRAKLSSDELTSSIAPESKAVADKKVVPAASQQRNPEKEGGFTSFLAGLHASYFGQWPKREPAPNERTSNQKSFR